MCLPWRRTKRDGDSRYRRSLPNRSQLLEYPQGENINLQPSSWQLQSHNEGWLPWSFTKGRVIELNPRQQYCRNESNSYSCISVQTQAMLNIAYINTLIITHTHVHYTYNETIVLEWMSEWMNESWWRWDPHSASTACPCPCPWSMSMIHSTIFTPTTRSLPSKVIAR